MKHSAVLTALLTTAMLTMASAPASAQNLAGEWEISRETGRGTFTQTLTLAVEGSTLTGSLSFTGGGRRGGGGGGGPQSFDISNGTIDGNSFSFTVTLSFGGNSIEQSYRGTIDGATLAGAVEGGRGGGAVSRPNIPDEIFGASCWVSVCAPGYSLRITWYAWWFVMSNRSRAKGG